jgi:glycosyltransferase involved in cell wall biosynthesis
MKKIAICGCFGGKNRLAGGQGAKTINLSQTLSILYDCKTVDTFNFKLKSVAIFLKIVTLYFGCDVFCVCLSRNGTKFVLRLLFFLRLFKRKPILYFPVGVCPLPVDYKPGDTISKKVYRVANLLKRCDCVFVETNALLREFKRLFSLKNIHLFKNYIVDYPPLFKESFDYALNKKLKIVYFSRINKGKNTMELIECVSKLKKEGFDLQVDFYGSLTDDFKSEFLPRMDNQTFFYKGYLKNEKTRVLSQYDCMVFTTSYLEGTPGAIIDAYFAGLPVLSQWFWASEELVQIPGCGDVSNDVYHMIKNALTKKNYLVNYQKNVYQFALSYYSLSEKEEIERIFKRYGN